MNELMSSITKYDLIKQKCMFYSYTLKRRMFSKTYWIVEPLQSDPPNPLGPNHLCQKRVSMP